nr:alpha/beta hydrolase [Rhodobaculum claviforme]
MRARALTGLSRRLLRPALAAMADPAQARRAFGHAARWGAPDPRGARYRRDVLGGVPVLRVAGPPGGARGVVLYVHGGAFVAGAADTHRALAARLAAGAGLAAVIPDYRLAPEHPFPAALEDVVAVLHALSADGPVVLAGDSAGGGLALSALAQATGPVPAGLVAFSPFVDLTLSGASWRENAARDALLPAARGDEVAALYLGGARADDPRASPLFARWQAPPPVLMFAARTEVLRDDAVRMARVLRAAGGRAEVRLAGDLPHVWPWLCPWLPEACATLAEAGAFAAACVQELRGAPTSR